MLENETKQKIGVFLGIDSPIVRLGARSLVSQQEDMEVVGQTDNANETSTISGYIPPRAVVVQTIIPRGSFEAVYRLREASPEISVIVLAEYEDDEALFQAIMTGASAFITKESTNEQLLDTIRRVFSGERLICQNILSHPSIVMRIIRAVP